MAKIDIRSGGNAYAPKNFAVIGSMDGAGWSILLQVENSGFPNDSEGGEERSWIIPKENRRAFTHIGIKVNTIPYNSVRESVVIKNIVMWEEE